MGKTSLVSNIPHVDASPCVESNALVYIMELAVKNIVGMLFLNIYIYIYIYRCSENVSFLSWSLDIPAKI
jgi:hypothetical protein